MQIKQIIRSLKFGEQKHFGDSILAWRISVRVTLAVHRLIQLKS